MHGKKLGLYVSAFILAVLTSSLAAYAADFVVTLTDTVVITDSAANNARSTSDTVPVADSVANNARSTSDTVPVADSVANNARSTSDTVVITDATGRDTPSRDDLVLSDFALPDSVALDTVALSDSPLVESFIFHEVFASDTVAIADDTAPDSTIIDVVALSDSSLVESFIFHELLASDVVAIADIASLFSTVFDTISMMDFTFLDSTVLDIVALSDSTLVESFIFHDITASDIVAMVDLVFPDSVALDILALSDSPLVESFIFHDITASDIVALVDAVSLFSTVFDAIAIVDFTFLDSTVLDIVALSDSTLVESFIFYELLASDIVAMADLVFPDSVVLDVVAISDSVATQVGIFFDVVTSDIVAISDVAALFSTVLDTVALADLVFPDSVALDILALSDSAEVDFGVFFDVVTSDIVALADIASLFSAAMDTLALSDIAELQFGVFNAAVVSDIVAIADAVSTFSSIIDIVQITEAVSFPLASVTDIVDIIVTTSIVTTKFIVEQLAVGDAFFDIAATFNRAFSEILALPDCVFTNESGVCNRVGLASIVLGDLIDLLFSSVNNPAELLAAQDQLARNFTGGRGPAESMQAGDSRAMSVVSPPPPPPPAIAAMPSITMAMTETMGEIDGVPDPKEAVEVEGTWDMDGFDNEALESLLGTMGVPIYDTSMTASSAGADEMTMVLPTFGVTADVAGEPSDGGIFITPTISDVPAGMQVMIPIDVEESVDGAGLDMLGNMTLNFAPADSASDFTMMIATLDSNPETDVTEERAGGIPAFYIDVSFAGVFAGSTTPSDEAFYEEPPQVTFTITEEWAVENDVSMPRGVPVINLFLLDETTGEWNKIPIGDIEMPAAAVDGVFTYTATLPHFSTYGVSGGRQSNDVEAGNEFAISLVESMRVSSAANLGAPLEGGGKVVIKDITESLAVRDVQPRALHQRVITVDDVQVAVSVADIRTAAVFGTAIATLNFEITNRGDTDEELMLEYWYSNAEGERVYEDSLAVAVDAGASSTSVIEIPFSSTGIHDVMIQVASRNGTVAATDIVIEVPWLAVYLYILVAIAAVVVAASVGYVLYVMRSRFEVVK